jgi:(p)ppGpp synthase/HD superfamily hydrolase
MTKLERAIAIAVEAHSGQVDKAGRPYILHPLRLMARMSSDSDMMAAVLHDVVEDGPGWTFERLAKEGIPPDVIEALRHLTKTPAEEEDYDAFVRRAGENPIARRVKLADLEDNMDIRRIAAPSQRDFERLAKYRRSWEYLRSLG